MTSTGQELVVVLGPVAIPESAGSALPDASASKHLAAETSPFSWRRSDLAIAWAWVLNYRRNGEARPKNTRPFKVTVLRTWDNLRFSAISTRRLGIWTEGWLAGVSGTLGGGMRCLPFARRAFATDTSHNRAARFLTCLPFPSQFVTANIVDDSESTTHTWNPRS